jgi:hypothetical protein
MNLKFSINKPEHGWLPCVLEINGKTFEIDASDVPTDPLDNLVDSLWRCCRGDNAEVWWHLEPAGYYFEFVPKLSELEFRVYFSIDSTNEKKELVTKAVCNKRETLLMFWKSLKKTSSFKINEHDWLSFDFKDMDKLKEAILKV